MIDRQRLLSDLQKLLGKLEADLLERSNSNDVPEIGKTLRSEHDRARKAERTAQSCEEWKVDTATQVAAAWVLSCVFVRFLEDNRLIDPPKIAGPADRLQRARDEHELYFRDHPRETDRDYLLSVFNGLANSPGVKDVFGEHNPVRELPNWLSGDAAGELLRFFRKIDADTGTLLHDFTDPAWDTRFLGDLYQDLSKAARKKYALLQTPEFVEEFILDRTLDPALDEFGLDAAPVKDSEGNPITSPGFRMIDPACGSGHFLLGSFRRILNRWQKQEPGAKVRDLVQRTLDSINGVDLNPYAVAIARFRLLLASMRACGITRLADAPAFRFNLACGDSLLHGVLSQGFLSNWSPIAHYFQSEDIETLRRLLVPSQYHAVVANPPYITPKDRALNEAYRERYSTCHMKYSLSVPFMERIFQLTMEGGFTGQITSNSFMKREFGKQLIEHFLPQLDLTHVIDTSLAYVPAHGTPTVIIYGRMRKPAASTIRCVRGIKRENEEPANPAKGLVWSAIVDQVDLPGSESGFVSVADSQRDAFAEHPWSLGGGGAAELRLELEESSTERLVDCIESIGFMSIAGEDEIFLGPRHFWGRRKISQHRDFGIGEYVRDWLVDTGWSIAFMYSLYESSVAVAAIDDIGQLACFFWSYRTNLRNRLMFGKLPEESGLQWYEYRFKSNERLSAPFLIVFAFVATHNHFVLDRGRHVFKQSAPVIKLKVSATEGEHLALLGLLNSSVAGFWLRQACHDKGGGGIGGGIAAETWERFFEYTGTKLNAFPLPEGRPSSLAHALDSLAALLMEHSPAVVMTRWGSAAGSGTASRLAMQLSESRRQWSLNRNKMIALQEELDWTCYKHYGLLTEDLTSPNTLLPLELGERAFEIVMARKIVAGELSTTWFERHGSTPIPECPSEWPEDYKQIVGRRMAVIENHPALRLIEQPEYKRRWNTGRWELQVERALSEWLLNRLETYFDFDGRMNNEAKATAKLNVSFTSVAKLADIARQDPDFIEAGEVYRDDAGFDVYRLVAELVEAESVPLLPVLRYKDAGLRKRNQWEKTWDLQRQEDAIDARSTLAKDAPQYLTPDQTRELKQREVGDIPVPPKYKGDDFLKSDYWRLRGKLDVPKERWVSFPHCEGQDGTLVIAWAGYDHLQLARAISTYYVDIQERQGGREDSRLVPLLACVIELLPWIKQWHNEPNTDFNGMRMGDYFEGFVQDEARQMGKTLEEVKAWQLPQRARARRARR